MADKLDNWSDQSIRDFAAGIGIPNADTVAVATLKANIRTLAGRSGYVPGVKGNASAPPSLVNDRSNHLSAAAADQIAAAIERYR